MELNYLLLWSFAGLCVLLFYLRHRRRVRAFLAGSLSGVTALVLLHLFGGAIGITPTLCTTNLLIAAILGIPGTALIALGSLL